MVQKMSQVAISYWEEGGNPVKQEAFSRLGEETSVDILDPTEPHPEIEDNGYELYHNAKRREGALQDHRTAEEAGIRTVNSADGAHTTIDRLSTLEALEELGIPTPEWDYGTPESISIDMPLVAKPKMELGEDRHDIIFYGMEEHGGLPFSNGSLDYVGERVVEEYVPTERHVKAYLVGDEVRAVELDDPLKWSGEEFEPSTELRDIVTRVGEGLGLGILEADVVERNGDRYVVDVNQTANLGGVSDAADLYEQALRSVLDY